MNSYVEAFVVFAVAMVAGIGTYASDLGNVPLRFDYDTATQGERTAYLMKASGDLNKKLRPNMFSERNEPLIGGRSIALTYTLSSSSLKCDGNKPCKLRQCERFLSHSVSSHNISVRIRYVTAGGKTVGSQLLKKSSCQQMADRASKI